MKFEIASLAIFLSFDEKVVDEMSIVIEGASFDVPTTVLIRYIIKNDILIGCHFDDIINNLHYIFIVQVFDIIAYQNSRVQVEQFLSL